MSEVRLRDLGRWFSGGTPPREVPEHWTGRLPWLSAKDISSTWLRSPTTFITQDAAREHSRVVPAGSILLIVRGMALAHGLPVVVTTQEVAFNQDLRALVCGAGIEPRFVYYALIGSRWRLDAHIDRAAHGTARVVDSMYSEHIRVPAIDEQREIADFLDRECARIEDLQTKLAAQREQLRELADRISSEALGGLEMVPLKRLLLESCVGIVVQPARLYQDSGPVPCLRPVNVKDGAVARDSLVWLSAEAHAANARSELREGDVIVVRSGQAGAAAVVPRWAAGGNCVDMLVLRPNPARCDPRYLCDFLNSELAHELIREHSVGSILGHMNLSAIRGVRCPWRPLPDQLRVVSKVLALRAALSRAQGEISNTARLLAEYRDALITEAVTGKLPVTA